MNELIPEPGKAQRESDLVKSDQGGSLHGRVIWISKALAIEETQ